MSDFSYDLQVTVKYRVAYAALDEGEQVLMLKVAWLHVVLIQPELEEICRASDLEEVDEVEWIRFLKDWATVHGLLDPHLSF